jgi:creatinine amidohydrolase
MTHPRSCLVDLPDDALWSSATWLDFAPRARRSRSSSLPVLPFFGFADWGLGRPLDLEETLGSAVLRRALTTGTSGAGTPLILPPLRFVLAPYSHTEFGVDFETALELTADIATSVRSAGFARLVLFTTSPWNEELIDVAGREARARLGLQVFLVTLAGIGLDLHPLRSALRQEVQHAACACYGCEPSANLPAADVSLGGFRPGNIRQPGPVGLKLSLPAAMSEGERLLDAAGARLASLLGEIARAKPPRRSGPVLHASRPAPRRR